MIIDSNQDSRVGLVFAAVLSAGMGLGAATNPATTVWLWAPLYALSLAVLGSAVVTGKSESIEGWRLWLATVALVYGFVLAVSSQLRHVPF
jgi:hypothetical protein